MVMRLLIISKLTDTILLRRNIRKKQCLMGDIGSCFMIWMRRLDSEKLQMFP